MCAPARAPVSTGTAERHPSPSGASWMSRVRSDGVLVKARDRHATGRGVLVEVSPYCPRRGRLTGTSLALGRSSKAAFTRTRLLSRPRPFPPTLARLLLLPARPRPPRAAPVVSTPPVARRLLPAVQRRHPTDKARHTASAVPPCWAAASNPRAE